MKKTIILFLMAGASVLISGCATGQVEVVGTDMENAESSAIQSTEYDADSLTLIVTFENAKAFKFLDVPPEAYQAMQNAESEGRYFNTQINGVFPYQPAE